MAQYSQEATVTAILDFYKYLSSIGAIPDSAILTPPASGWPDVNSTTLSGLGKTEEVIDLLRHLPYISQDLDGNRKIAYKTSTIQYNDKADIRWVLDRNKVEGILSPVSAGVIPPHVAVLTTGARYGSWLLLDTHEGKTPQEKIALSRSVFSSEDFAKGCRRNGYGLHHVRATRTRGATQR
jgi:hypothetical protein